MHEAERYDPNSERTRQGEGAEKLTMALITEANDPNVKDMELCWTWMERVLGVTKNRLAIVSKQYGDIVFSYSGRNVFLEVCSTKCDGEEKMWIDWAKWEKFRGPDNYYVIVMLNEDDTLNRIGFARSSTISTYLEKIVLAGRDIVERNDRKFIKVKPRLLCDMGRTFKSVPEFLKHLKNPY